MLNLPLIFSSRLLLSCICFLLLPLILSGQEYLTEEADLSLVPYLKDSLYGYADREGRMVIEPAYQEAFHFISTGVAMVKKNGRYGFIDRQGRAKTPFFLEQPAPRSPVVPQSFREQFVKVSFFDGRRIKEMKNIWQLVNARQEQSAFLFLDAEHAPRLFYRNDSLPYRERLKQIWLDAWNSGNFVFGYKRVVLEDGGVNFLDTLGRLALATPLLNGSALGDGRFCFVQPDGGVGVQDVSGKVIIPPIYTSIQRLGSSRYLSARGRRTEERTDNRALLSWEGEVLTDTAFQEIRHMHGDFFAARQGERYGLINARGDTVLPFEFHFMESYNRRYLIVHHHRGVGYRIIDESGAAVNDRLFDKVEAIWTWDYHAGRRGDTLFLLDPEGRPGPYFIGVRNLSRLKPDLLPVQLSDQRYMLYNKTGEQLLPDTISEIRPVGFDSLYLVKIAGDRGVFQRGQGWLYAPGEKNIGFEYSSREKAYELYYIEGEERVSFVGGLENKRVEVLPRTGNRPSPFRAYEKKGDRARAVLQDGREVYIPLGGLRHQVCYNREHIWFLVQNERGEWAPVTLNGREVLPEGFQAYNAGGPWDSTTTVMPAFPCRGPNREMGLIDLQGRWCIEPSATQQIEPLDGFLFAVEKDGATYLHNHRGERIQDTPYRKIKRLNPFLLKAQLLDGSAWHLLREDGSRADERRYRYLRSYHPMEMDESSLIEAGLMVDSVEQACLLSPRGEDLACVPFPELQSPCFDPWSLLVVGKDRLFGLVDRQGEVVIPLAYKTIECLPEGFYLLKKNYREGELISASGDRILSDVPLNLQNTMSRVGPDRYLFGARKRHILIDGKGRVLAEITAESVGQGAQWDISHREYLSARTEEGRLYYISLESGRVFRE